jgi:hypothetical protein
LSRIAPSAGRSADSRVLDLVDPLRSGPRLFGGGGIEELHDNAINLRFRSPRRDGNRVKLYTRHGYIFR